MPAASQAGRCLLGVGVLALTGCGLQVGRAPLAVPAVQLGEVQVGVPEPRLQEDLQRALAAELQRRTALGPGPVLNARVVSAQVAPVAANHGLWEARLAVELVLGSTEPRSLTLRGERLFEGTGDGWEPTNAARAAAFGLLAEQLVAEGVPLLLGAGGPAP